MAKTMFYNEHWTKELAIQERERRKTIGGFAAAMPKFAELLSSALEADIKKYEEEFPGEKATVERNASDGNITVNFPTAQSLATIKFHPDKQSISCAFEGTKDHASVNFSLEVSPLGIQCNQRAPEYCAKDLSEKILKVLLFSRA